jgi:putative flavoprotein involved in K+ transport
MTRLAPTLDVLVIGAGQAGLALGYHLRTTSLRFQFVDRHARVGDSWRDRYDSLVLFTPRAYSGLPGLPVPGDPEGYPTKDELGDYLERYAVHFELPVVLGTSISRLERGDDGFQVTTDAEERITARAVVLATGAFQRPAVPAMAQGLAPEVLQLTPESYQRPAQIPAGTVLVVGDGATGRQIAKELAEDHRVLLATGKSRRVSPERILGKSIFWWMDRLGVLRASGERPVGRYLMRADPFPGKALDLTRLEQQSVQVVGRVLQTDGHQVRFAAGQAATIDAVIWTTGYRDDSTWVAIPEATDAEGAFIHQAGISPVPGLYFIGRSWQRTRGSALLLGVGDDAAFVARRLVEQVEERPVALPHARPAVSV